MAKSSRVGAIDFWRGLALIAILIDHTPGNWLEYATPRNFGLSDSAEAFIFLSGLAVGLIYTPRALKHGRASVFVACLKRALKLYGAHIATTVAALIIFGLASHLTGLDRILSEHGRALIFSRPVEGAAGIAMLSHQIGYFNILPMYIAMMIWAPIAVALTLASPGLALMVSAALYFAARAFGLNLPNWPEAGNWFFNPLTWQLIFTFGVAAARTWRDEPPTRDFVWVAVSSVILVAGALVVTDAFGFAPGLRDVASSRLDVSKQDLGLARLAHFCALAYLIAVSKTLAQWTAGRFGESVQRLGRHSLPVFIFGSLLAAVGQATMTILATNAAGPVVHAVGFAYTLTAIAASFALAHRLDCQHTAATAPVYALSVRSPWRASSGSEPSTPSA